MSYSDRKVWFVTGSSSGLGHAVVERVLEQGDRVVATLRKPKDVSDLVLKYSKDQLLVAKLDVVVPSDIKTAFASAIEKFGRVDIVYNNAGYASIGEVEGMPDEMAPDLFEVNFWGSTNIAREAIRVFRDVNEPRGGRLLQVSSMVGIQPITALGFYSASKYAMEGISQALSSELHPSWNIKVTILEFGGFRTRAHLPQGMPIAPPHPAYMESDSPTAIFRQKISGAAPKQGGDANKAALVIYKVALDESVGLRVPLGADALAKVASQWEMIHKDTEAAAKWNTDLESDD